MKAKDLFSVTKQSFQEWLEDRATNEAAALAYYTLLSVPALLLLIQWILGQVVSSQVQQRVLDFIVHAVRGGGQDALTALIKNANQPGSGGLVATIVSLVTLAVSATGVVVQLEEALNRMWEVAEKDSGIMQKIRERFSSLLMVLALGVFLLLSVTASTFISGFAQTLAGSLPFGEWVLQGINIAVSLILLTILFGATLKVVPDAEVAWRDVWLGAIVTSVLFIVGQYALSIYLGKSAPGSAYGAAGSIVAFVVWVYYSALILFLGAEFTQVYANRFGSHIRPDEDAIPLEQKIDAEQAAPGREPAADAGEMPAEDENAQPPQEAPGRPLAGARAYTMLRPESREEEEKSYLQYYTVAILALFLGLWRWLRRNGR